MSRRSNSTHRYFEKHVNRMSIAKLKKQLESQILESLPGSGNVWTNTLTKPKAPKITGLTLKKSMKTIEEGINSLKRPFSPNHCSYTSNRKRH